MGNTSGHRNKPRSGSLAYTPRKRAKSSISRNTTFTESDKVKLLGFPGYKAGMTHVLKQDDRPHAITKGKEIFVPVTVIETPPIVICAIRGYANTSDGEKVVTEHWAPNLSKDLGRLLCVQKKVHDFAAFESSMSEGKIDDIKVIIYTQPRLIKLKKKPDLMECGVGGKSLEEKIKFCKELMGKEVRVQDVFEGGNMVDASGITKGKGFQGPVKRWGITIQNRKVNDARRHVGCIGPWNPSRTMWTVAMAGQLGYQQRTEFNKRILRVHALDEVNVTPDGGFLHYGVLHSDYVLVRGSIPGPTKRLVKLRDAIRPPRHMPVGKPQLTFISTSSGQGD
ncbi:MAG: 50S ribosomal protein L3 [Candidatus Methanofastidiosa archaeon]|nr:50S ribosomal protein L3 [Candidatus Methanofastidiosa archaeon]